MSLHRGPFFGLTAMWWNDLSDTVDDRRFYLRGGYRPIYGEEVAFVAVLGPLVVCLDLIFIPFAAVGALLDHGLRRIFPER